jgi:hypothetical protein
LASEAFRPANASDVGSAAHDVRSGVYSLARAPTAGSDAIVVGAIA